MPLTSHPFAVIDIGSNSVRMVVYHALDRVPMPLFNEKYYCALAHGLEDSGKLSPEGVEKAHQALARFVLMLQRFHIDSALVIATAAMRDASDGDAFVQEVRKRHGLEVQIIDGDREAALAGLGIIASMWQPAGLCADLGGGSLELALIENGNITQMQTLPLGALRLQAQFGKANSKLRHHIRLVFSQVSWLQELSQTQCYAIGGGFRGVAKLHQREQLAPLRLLHEYRLSSDDIKRMSQQLDEEPSPKHEAMADISSKRGATLPFAACALDELLRYTGAKQAIFSVAGIREGLMYDQLPAPERGEDPLIASAQVLSTIAGRKGHYAEELFAWMQPLFEHDDAAHHRLRRALCWISEIAWTIDPNFRAQWAFLRVLQSDMKGLSHPERVMLAVALFHRYQVKMKKDYRELSLLSEKQRCWAQMAGIATNLAFQLSGGRAGNLHHANLALKDGAITLLLDEAAAALYTEIVAKRLDGLSCALSAFSSSRITA